jgi:hypothetical protein
VLEVRRGTLVGAVPEDDIKDESEVVSLSESRVRLLAPRSLPLLSFPFSLPLFLPLPTWKALPPREAFSLGMSPHWFKRKVVRGESVIKLGELLNGRDERVNSSEL